jgi:hypothetical protein
MGSRRNDVEVCFAFGVDDHGNMRRSWMITCIEGAAWMDHVILRNVPHLTCPKCGTERVEIDRPAQLHRLLAEVLRTPPSKLRLRSPPAPRGS